MIRVNLLPVRAKIRKENVRQIISVYLLSVLLLVAVIGFLWVSRGLEISRLEARLKQVQAEVAGYAKYEKILKDLQAKKAIIEKKRQTILSLQQDRDNLVRVLALLSVEIPPERGFLFSSAVLGVGLVMLVGVMAASAILWSWGVGPVFTGG